MVFDRSPKPVEALVKENAIAAADLRDLASKLDKPQAIWLMVPAAAVDNIIADLVPHLESGDILIDGGNSYYIDDIRRATTPNGCELPRRRSRANLRSSAMEKWIFR